MTPTDVTLPTQLALDPAAQDLLFRDARTANAFTDEPVTPEDLRAVHDLVRWAPTAMNTQPLRVVLVQPGPGRDRLVPLMNEGNRAKTATAPLVAILAADTRFHEHLPSQFPGRGEAVRDAMEGDAPGREASALLSTGLQIGYFIIGVRAAGLAPARWPGSTPMRSTGSSSPTVTTWPGSWSTSATPARTRTARATRGWSSSRSTRSCDQRLRPLA